VSAAPICANLAARRHRWGATTVGQEVEARTFSRADRLRYREKLRRCLDVFGRMLNESKFDFERPLTGTEIEFNLVDAQQDPAMRNEEVLAAIADEVFQAEMGQFNIEMNVRPTTLAGTAAAASSGAIRSPTPHHSTSTKTPTEVTTKFVRLVSGKSRNFRQVGRVR
jgi:hypothetical protein